ncbi:MAG: CYTH domain-containing protein [Paludibacter sp.]|nr:CYTH domain-containing protein [Paludibacter sp.]MDD4197843.1 CYTH domain-containing protein [Paludibacter sp.]MDD4427886.1 CYTH domain-containing protein [Paludibacter sp.]
MPQETERKFLVTSAAYKKDGFRRTHIIQGYISINPEATVRIRIRDNQAYLTIKGKSNEQGTSRFEWEKEIDVTEARELLQLCSFGLIEKYRYEVSASEHVFEVDEFLGLNAGLVVAEIELKNEADFFEKPAWLGEEVTGDKRYYNAMLSQHPFNQW